LTEARTISQVMDSLERVLTPADLAAAFEDGRRLTGDQPIQLAISALGESS